MNITENVKKAVEWIDIASTTEYIYTSSDNSIPYHEVTGYYIPTLIEYGDKKRAKSFAKYLISQQKLDGSWDCHGQYGQSESYIFDTPQIIDGLCEYRLDYQEQIGRAVKWTVDNLETAIYVHHDMKRHPYLRIMYCLKKAGYDIGQLSSYLNDRSVYNFDVLSHFYAYGFEGCARLGMDCKPYIDKVKEYNGLIPERMGTTTYCTTGLSQVALSLFLCGEYQLGMNTLEYVTKFQNASGGFYGSNGKYFPDKEISWAVKFYLDAVIEAQRCWFRQNFHIFSDQLEKRENDKRFIFIKDNIKESDKVLEVGSGKGRYINKLNCDRYACDILNTSKYLDAQFSIGSALNLSYEDNTFDIVFCCESLEHSLLPERAIDECLRVLKKGGKLLIIDKDKKTKYDGLLFSEQWLDFDAIKSKYDAEISDLSQPEIALPFWGAKIIKRDS